MYILLFNQDNIEIYYLNMDFKKQQRCSQNTPKFCKYLLHELPIKTYINNFHINSSRIDSVPNNIPLNEAFGVRRVVLFLYTRAGSVVRMRATLYTYLSTSALVS